MKTINRFFILIGLVLFFTQSTSAQTTYTITLSVDTEKITKDNLQDVCSFKVESPNQKPILYVGDLTKFIIHVDAKDVIIWQGISTNNPTDDEVNIASINYYGGENVFDREVLYPSEKDPRIVKGTVKKGSKGYEEKYSLKFNVVNSGRTQNITFEIDPKISVKR